MSLWFLKGNSRRYFRIQMPIRVFVAPASPIKDREIYATGVDYFPPIIQSLIEKQRNETFYWIDRIQDHKELLTELFREVIESVELFGKAAEQMSKGINPRNDPAYWMNLSKQTRGFEKIDALQSAAPKTHKYFKLIEEKYLVFINAMTKSVQESTPYHFEADPNIPFAFKIEEILEDFKKEKFSKIPLVQSLLSLSSFMDTYLEAYRQINDDNVMRLHPEKWRSVNVNISASGLAMMFRKRFDTFQRVDVFFYFPENNRVLQFEGSIVDIRSIEDTHSERIAINFEFPEGREQDFLQFKIQEFELDECTDFEFKRL